MQFRTVAVVAVALLVALSGCSALEELNADGPSNETTADTDDLEDATSDASDDDNGTADETENESGASDGADEDANADGGADENANADGGTDENATADDGDDTADAEWSPPEEPNTPLERKDEDRIERVEFVDKEPADGDGYSNFNLEVVANTSMENVDPAEHGDVVGEPYFFVKINEGPDNRKIVERTGQVRMEEDGTFHIDVRPAGIEEFGDGPLTVEVYLMDEDKDWDDVYGAVGETIHFNPDTDGTDDADSTETTADSDADESETTDNSDADDTESSEDAELEDSETDGNEN